MNDTIVLGSVQTYFGEALSDVLGDRKERVEGPTQAYLVDLLARFTAREQLFETSGGEAKLEPLAFLLKRALEGDPPARRRELRRLGDTALFVSGFFGDSVARSMVGLDYYVGMGERAYDALADEPHARAKAVFTELARRFPLFVDVFAEIAELAELRSNRGLVRLYERFLLTGSERVARRLRERGVALFAGPGTARYGPAEGRKPSC